MISLFFVVPINCRCLAHNVRLLDLGMISLEIVESLLQITELPQLRLHCKFRECMMKRPRYANLGGGAESMYIKVHFLS